MTQDTNKPITITHDGITDTISGWAKRTGLPASAIRSRLEYGWAPQRILTTPVRKRASRHPRRPAILDLLTAAEARAEAAEAERDRLAALVGEAKGALQGLTDALDAVDAEAERADKPGATAWSSAPLVALRYKRQEARVVLAKMEKTDD